MRQTAIMTIVAAWLAPNMPPVANDVACYAEVPAVPEHGLVRSSIKPAVVRNSPAPAQPEAKDPRVAHAQAPARRDPPATTSENRLKSNHNQPVVWLSAEQVRRQLDQPVSINWVGVPLRQALQNLARSQRVAILLDRRTDADQKLELALIDTRLEEALARIATRFNLGTSRIGPVIYLGPQPTAERLRTLVELRKQEIHRLPPAVRMSLTALKRCRWEMLATPRDLLAEAARDYRLRLESPAAVPHDLWPAGELPPVGLAERVSLIAAQFDLTFELADDARTLRLVPMPDQAVLEKKYVSSDASAVVSRLKSLLTRSQIEASAAGFMVRGPAEEQEIVEILLSGKPSRQTTVIAGEKVYQLNIAMPVGRLIKELATKLDLEIQIDESAMKGAGINLDLDVKVSVKDVSEDQLWRAVLEPAGLTFERAGETLVVRPK